MDTLDLIEEALSEGDFDQALKHCKKAMKSWPGDADVWMLSGETALNTGDPEGAVKHLRQAIEIRPGDYRARVGLSQALLETARSSEALEVARAAAELAPDDGSVVYHLAIAMEVNGQERDALIAYECAAKLEPEIYFMPTRLSRDAFDALVKEALNLLPQDIQDALENISISVKDIPDAADVPEGEPPLSPLLLGVFMGYSLAEQSGHDPWSTAQPSRIVLYQRNLERSADCHDELVRQIRITVFHEVGHFLGLTEEDLHDRGLE